MSGQSCPETLSDLVDWINTIESNTGEKILNAFCPSKNSIDAVFIKGTNTTVGVQIDPIGASKKLLRNAVNYQRVLKQLASKIPITRLSVNPVSTSLLFERNLQNGQTDLRGKSIAVIGCGTIGGHLAKQLIHCGAGTGAGGKLILIDNQKLSIENISRHFLGPNYIGKSKSKSLASELQRTFHRLEIRGIEAEALASLAQLQSIDLIVDATGEEALSISISEWIKAEHLDGNNISGLCIFLIGNADAAQGLLLLRDEYACYNCIANIGNSGRRYNPLIDPKLIETRIGPCGEAPFVPYGIGGSVTAAALATNMIMDWVSDSPSPRLRTVRINQSSTKIVKDVNPSPTKDCPVCMQRSVESV